MIFNESSISEKIISRYRENYDNSVLKNNLEARMVKLENISNKISKIAIINKNTEIFELSRYLNYCLKTYNSWITNNHYERTPRGQIYIISSSNITFLGIYLWAISFICGNYSVVRISKRINDPFIDTIVEIICNSMLDQYDLFYRPEDEKVARLVSKSCAVRTIWGSDETIKQIRTQYESLSCIDIAFKSRYSACIINQDQYCTLDENNKNLLAKNYYNDTLALSFNACSSPHYTYFYGNMSEFNKVTEDFTRRLENLFLSELFTTSSVISTRNLLKSQRLILQCAESDAKYIQVAGQYIATGANINIPDILKFVSCKSICEISKLLPNNIQSITYYENDKLALMNLRGIIAAICPDRFVKIGHALKFDVIWDGINLFESFTKAHNYE